MSGWRVTANDIKNWTDIEKRRAEEILPLLVKKLIHASSQPISIDFPSGNAVATPGWDGTLEVETGNEFIPAGKSGWEFGTDSAVKGKADDDFDKRSNNPTPLSMRDTTFVFVTSRPWTKYKNWVENKKLLGTWKDVKGINAQGLEDWLNKCPSVERWFAEVIGKRSADLLDVDLAWSKLSSTTTVKLTTDFFLYGRDNEQEQLLKLLEGAPNVYRVKSRSKLEAYAFLLSVITNNEGLKSRCLVVSNQTAWDSISSANQQLILIANGFQPNNIGAAKEKGNHILLAIDEKDTKDPSIVLSQQARLARQQAIQKLGFDEQKAVQIYQDTKGYLKPVLRHEMMGPIDYIDPVWPQNTPIDVLFAIFFATEWNEVNVNDKEILSNLSGKPYSELEKIITELSKSEDPPIRKVGTIWQVISKFDLWLIIASSIANLYLSRFADAIKKVITDIDPSYELPGEERYMASIKGAIPCYSRNLKHGIADSMTILAVYGDEYNDQLGTENPSALVNHWVKELFRTNNNTPFWYSINNIVRAIAEAAPEAFLDAVDDGSAGDESPLLGLFKTESSGSFGGCYHSGLLWALELVSWNKQFFGRASVCLARLSEIDPGGTWGNRPFNSLVHMYLGWINNNTTTHAERLVVLSKVLIPQFPNIAWQLMVQLLFNKTTHTSGLNKPEYREWSNSFDKRTTEAAYFGYVNAIVDFMFEMAEFKIDERAIDLIDNFSSYTEVQNQKIISLLLNIKVQSLTGESRKVILTKLRDTISHHREFPNAKWSWPKKVLSSLEKVLIHLDYKDVILANLYLFDEQWPKLTKPVIRGKGKYEERDENIKAIRIAALQKIYEERGEKGLIELINSCKLPRIVGAISYSSNIKQIVEKASLNWLNRKDSLSEFAIGYLYSMIDESYDYSRGILESNNRWSGEKKAKFLLCMPLHVETLQLVEKLNQKGKKYYWSNLNHYTRSREIEVVSQIVTKLLEYNRPLAAVDVLGQLFYGSGVDTSNLDCNLVASLLIRIATKPTDIDKISLQYVRDDISNAVVFLQDSGGLPEQEIRQIEWLYLKMFRFENFTPRFLMKSVSDDHSFFVQLVVWAFNRRVRQDPIDDIEEVIKEQRSELAYELLDIISILPGQYGNDINQYKLTEWVKSARTELAQAGRADIGDDRIGAFLARCPAGLDGIWPHEAVRSVIEFVRSEKLDISFRVSHTNMRGTTSRHPYDGGQQERALAQKYNTDAEAIQLIYPRTAKLLRSIGESYSRDAQWHDREVELMD